MLEERRETAKFKASLGAESARIPDSHSSQLCTPQIIENSTSNLDSAITETDSRHTSLQQENLVLKEQLDSLKSDLKAHQQKTASNEMNMMEALK